MSLRASAGASHVVQRYLSDIDGGELEPNEHQAGIVARLGELELALAMSIRPSGLFGMFRKKPDATPKGVYLHGGVGRGKTMLMDLFYSSVPFEPKARHHFHEFMAEIHDRITQARKTVPGDPIPAVAADLAERARLLCFDELHVTDIADAMILGRLFTVLFESGVVVVATSNARPEELYRHGLNRQLFLPFIDLIEDYMEVVELDAGKDFRLEKLSGRPLYYAPADNRAEAELDSHWQRLTGRRAVPAPLNLEVLGRQVEVPMAAMGVARFPFADLCERPLGPRDYLHIARAFHTVLIDGIPVLTPSKRNEARRFVNLIDALYDNRVGLIASADAEPDGLYPAGDGADLFQRTASRLMEMRSESYLSSRKVRASGPDAAASL